MLRPLRVPSVGGEPRGLGNWPTLIALIAGFTLSAAIVGAAAVALGRAIGASSLAPEAALAIAASVLGLLVLADGGRLGLRVPMLRRQTPKEIRALPGTLRGLVWGLDTGTMISTYRTSGITWGALVLAVLAAGPEWIGLAYAAGFCLPLLAGVVGPEAVCDAGRLLDRRRTVQRACRAAMLGAVVLVGIGAL